MNARRSASSILTALLLAALAACGSSTSEVARAGAQADDVQPCDPDRPETWHYVNRPVEVGEPIMAVVVDGSPVTFDGTCDPSEEAYCGWQQKLMARGGGSPDGVLGWLVSNTCAVHAQYSYRVMFFDAPSTNDRTWRINDQYAKEPPVFALSILPQQRVRVLDSRGCDATDDQGLCVAPRLTQDEYLTKRAHGGIAAGDPSNPPLRPQS